jgi:hypothetical protein
LPCVIRIHGMCEIISTKFRRPSRLLASEKLPCKIGEIKRRTSTARNTRPGGFKLNNSPVNFDIWPSSISCSRCILLRGRPGFGRLARACAYVRAFLLMTPKDSAFTDTQKLGTVSTHTDRVLDASFAGGKRGQSPNLPADHRQHLGRTPDGQKAVPLRLSEAFAPEIGT